MVERGRRIDPDALFMGGVYFALSVILLLILYPLLYVVSASLSDPIALVGRVPAPVGRAGFLQARLREPDIWTVTATLLHVLRAIINIVLP
jgi:putative aldouronate transport system permease protein